VLGELHHHSWADVAKVLLPTSLAQQASWPATRRTVGHERVSGVLRATMVKKTQIAAAADQRRIAVEMP